MRSLVRKTAAIGLGGATLVALTAGTGTQAFAASPFPALTARLLRAVATGR